MGRLAFGFASGEDDSLERFVRHEVYDVKTIFGLFQRGLQFGQAGHALAVHLVHHERAIFLIADIEFVRLHL